jgi:prepilin-type N-terminal cleavage/methylation domain-containing protein
MMRRRAFTLIEVMAVVIVLGLLAGATVWRMTEQMRRGSRAGAIGRIAYADRMARLSARYRGRECILRFDLDRHGVRRYEGPDETRRGAGDGIRLPVTHEIDRVVVSPYGEAGETAQHPDGRSADSGVVDIPYSKAGRSPSYALRLRCGSEAVWLVVSGLTGQISMQQDQQEVDHVFTMLSTGRPDAP